MILLRLLRIARWFCLLPDRFVIAWGALLHNVFVRPQIRRQNYLRRKAESDCRQKASSLDSSKLHERHL